ncbi:hypothetical protein L210DRAFT_3508249 [Boletus edulis BED1]|uniref:Uncharacterized protein n=1 Tax=Boletus edulis BED1 TaxID=1328754 RepID=A0AAD4BHS8_BOLED|nr:hypothetical protein L210DRAFT_3508249 [Boletus edulis BED1]
MSMVDDPITVELTKHPQYVSDPRAMMHAHAQIVLHPLMPPPAIAIPCDHEISKHNGFIYVQPELDMQAPFYIIIHAPYVDHVSGAVYARVQKLDDGFMLLIGAINDMLVEYL